MSQQLSAEWLKAKRIFFRLLFTYLILFFLFMEGFIVSKFSWLAFIQKPFAKMSESLLHFVNTHFKWVSFFPYTDILCYFMIALIISIAWALLDKRKSYPTLFKYLHTLSRYYLAIVLLSYGLWKITLLQFTPPWPSWLIEPLGELRPFILFWNFAGASRSYQFFGGLMELIPAVLLLFRRTSTLGALIAVGTLMHVLMLNIGYEVAIISFLLHLLLIGLAIIGPDLKRLYAFFVVHETHPLSVMPVALGQNRHRWIRYGLKLSLIAYVMFAFVGEINENLAHRFGNQTFYSLHGIYNVQEFQQNHQSIPPLKTDSLRWNKLAIDGIGGAKIVYMNDSSEYYYNMKLDTTAHILEFYNDSTSINKFHYSLATPDKYVFEGRYKNDSIRFVADRVDLTKLPLFRNRNKVRWTWTTF